MQIPEGRLSRVEAHIWGTSRKKPFFGVSNSTPLSYRDRYWAFIKLPSMKAQAGLEVIKLEFILKIKRNDWLLADTCPQVANHCALFELFYYLEARCHRKTGYHCCLRVNDFVCVDTLRSREQFPVMSGRIFLGWTGTKQRIKCLVDPCSRTQRSAPVMFLDLESSTHRSFSESASTARHVITGRVQQLVI